MPDQMDDYIRSALNTCRWEIDPRLIGKAFLRCRMLRLDVLLGGYVGLDRGDQSLRPEVCEQEERSGCWLVCNAEHGKNDAREMGVQILTEHSAKKLVMEDGKVTGVVAEDAGGEVHISCRACLMATGNISYGDVLKRTLPSYYYADPSKQPPDAGEHLAITSPWRRTQGSPWTTTVWQRPIWAV